MHKTTLLLLTLCAALSAQTAPKAKKMDPSLVPVQEEAGLPRVLLIGDSISMGYTLPVRELLKGKANILRPLENAGDTARGIKRLDGWLGKGKQVALPPRYEANLRVLVERLKKTGAKLIWASTTPVPDGTLGRVKSDEIKYNEVALKVMQENGIPVDDLHAVVASGPADMQRTKNVHFTDPGYQLLARSVAASIEAALPKH